MYSVEKTKGINFINRFDYLLFATVIILSTIGLMALHSVTHTARDNGMFKIQVISIIMGIMLALVVSMLDYKDFKIIGIALYVISVVLLFVVLFKGEGYQSWGSSSWLKIPVVNMSFQPSELAKITVIMVTAIYFEKLREGQTDRKNFIKLAVTAAVPIALVVLQPDYGTAMVFIFMLVVMVFVYGIKYRYIFITMGAFLAVTPLIWFFALNDKRRNRILTFINPSSDPMDSGFQVMRSKLAIGSGQIFGKGLYKGIQTQNNGVPVQESDFIFSAIGEELGFIGAVVVVALILFLLLRCLYIAMKSRDAYGSFMVIGLTGMLGFHFIENIGMCIGLMPVTGIPLPFISAGGSAMVTNYFAVGIIMSVSMRRKRAIFNSSD